jgi:hypothetical protein
MKIPEPLEKATQYTKRAWNFVWHGKSIWSYIAFVVLAYIFLKYLLYPGFLFIVGWRDIVAVLSSSMYHGPNIDRTFYSWLDAHNYTGYESWPFMSGLNIGDVVIVTTVLPEDIHVGDVIVFISNTGEPIIHRVIEVLNEGGNFYYTTKGDANPSSMSFELKIPYNVIVGKGVASAPILGIPRVLLSYIIGF